MTAVGYTKWKGRAISKAKPSSRSEQLKDEAREVAKAHSQLKQDFLGRERKRKAAEKRHQSQTGGQR